MKKIIATVSCVCIALVCLASAPLEAGKHCHHCHHRSTSFSVGVGQTFRPANDVYVVRQYVQPAPAVMYVAQPQAYVAQPAYYAPVYVAPQPAVYVEEMRVVRPNPFVSTGLSFSWSWFK